MNKILPIASLVLAAGALSAQTGMNVKANINVSANKVVKTLKAGAVKSSAYASARDGKSWWRADASASKSVRHYVSKYSGSSYASVSDSASARAGTNTASVAKGSVDVTIKHAKKGSLVLTYYGRGKATLTVSGGAKWAPKANGKRQSMTVKVTVATGTISFNVASDASAAASAKAGAYSSNSFSAVFIPEFNATTCTIKAGTVKGCTNGGTLAGSSALSGRRHSVTLKLTGAKASSWFINLIGAADKGNAMANKCLLLDKPMWAGFGRTDSKGNGTSRFSVSATKAISAFMQSAVINFNKGFSINTSNTLGISCK